MDSEFKSLVSSDVPLPNFMEDDPNLVEYVKQLRGAIKEALEGLAEDIRKLDSQVGAALFLKADGKVPLTDDWDAGAHDITCKDMTSTGNATVAGNAEIDGSLDVDGGEVKAGMNSSVRGFISLWDGAGGNTPGYARLGSPNGTVWCIFIEDDGTVKVHNAAPTQNSDGDAIGDQTD